MATTTPTEWKTAFKVNTTDFDAEEVENTQNASQVVGLAGGGFVVVWLDHTDPLMLGAPDIFGQIYDALGNPVGDELKLLNAFVDYAQGPPQVTALSDGGFLLAYQTTADPLFGEGENIVAERFDAQGSPTGQSLLVGASASDETQPSIVSFADDSYAVVYADNDGGTDAIMSRVVDAGGTPGAEFLVSDGVGSAGAPSAAVLSGGNFVVAYVRSDGGNDDIAFSIRTAAGAEVESDTAATGASAQTAVDVAALAGGGFVLVWRDADGEGAGQPGIMARRYAADGTALAAAAPVNGTTAGDQDAPAVAGLADGGYVVTWDDNGADVLRAQRFDAAGDTVGDEFVIASPADESQPSFALLADGRLVVSFTNEAGGNADIHAGIWDPRSSPITGTSGDDVLTSRLEGATLIGGDGADILHGQGGDDVLIGGAGQDTLVGGGGTDTADYSTSIAAVRLNLTTGTGLGGYAHGDSLSSVENVVGSAFGDTLTGSAAANRLDGGAGDDLLVGSAGADQMIGGAGIDTADFSNSPAMIRIDLGTGLSQGGTAHADRFDGVENIVGSAFADVLVGDAGATRLDGGAGDDLLLGSAGADQMIGGAGRDRVDFRNSVAAVRVDLINGTGIGGYAHGDSFAGIEIVWGSDFGDRLIGGWTLDGQEGDDVLIGDAGINQLYGNVGDDVLVGSAGADWMDGSSGIDTVDFSTSIATVRVDLASGTGVGGYAHGDTFSGIENVIGSAYADRLIGDAAANRLDGGAGADVQDGGDGDDVLLGSAGADQLIGGAGIDTADFSGSVAAVTVDLVAGTGMGGYAHGDTFSGIENVVGSAFADTLTAGAGGNRLYGGAGDDFLAGGAGGDEIIGGAGFDTVNYGASNAAVTVNFLTGQVSGGHGEGDTISGVEAVWGSGHGNLFISGVEANYFDGGGGLDTVSYAFSDAAVTVNLSGGTFGSGGHAQGDTFNPEIESIVGSAFADSLTGWFRQDRLDGGAGADVLDGGAGDDVLVGSAGADQMIGGAGIDTADFSSSIAGVTVTLKSGTGLGGYAHGDTFSGVENVTGSGFADTLIGGDGINVLHGGDGDDRLVGSAGADQMIGGAGIDTIDFSTSIAAVTVGFGLGFGGYAHNDTISGFENFIGSAFADTLRGDAGDNVYTGGAGNDRFVFGNGTGSDTITDFTEGAGTDDVVDLAGNSSLNSFADVLANATQQGADTVIDLGGGSQLTLLGVTRLDLHRDDFTF